MYGEARKGTNLGTFFYEKKLVENKTSNAWGLNSTIIDPDLWHKYQKIIISETAFPVELMKYLLNKRCKQVPGPGRPLETKKLSKLMKSYLTRKNQV